MFDEISGFPTKKSRFSIVYFRNEEIRRRDRHHAKLWKKSVRKCFTISKWAFGERIFSGGGQVFFSCFRKITMVVLSWDESGKYGKSMEIGQDSWGIFESVIQFNTLNLRKFLVVFLSHHLLTAPSLWDSWDPGPWTWVPCPMIPAPLNWGSGFSTGNHAESHCHVEL